MKLILIKKGGFDVNNLTKNSSNLFKLERELTYIMNYPIEQTLSLSLPKSLKNIATRCSKEYNKVFNVNEKQSVETKENVNKKASQKEQMKY